MVKKISALLSSVAVGGLLAAAPALADGGPAPRRAAPPPAPVHSWTGLYIGGYVGAAMSDVTVWDMDNFNAGTGGLNPNRFQNSGGNTPDFMGGLTIGYNFQVHSLVLGVEGEIGGMDVNRSTQYPPFQGVANRIGDSVAGVSMGFYGAITGRLGITLGDPKLLLYGKAGWGWADTSVSFNDTNTLGNILVSGTSRSATLGGAVYGGGLEWAFDRNWSAKIEYLHFDLGSITHTATAAAGTSALGIPTARFNHDVSVDTVKVGINYKF